MSAPHVLFIARHYQPEDVIDGEIVNADTREAVIDCAPSNDHYYAGVDQAVFTIFHHGLTFYGDAKWASDPDGPRIINNYTGERAEVSAHLFGFSDDERAEIIARVKAKK